MGMEISLWQIEIPRNTMHTVCTSTLHAGHLQDHALLKGSQTALLLPHSFTQITDDLERMPTTEKKVSKQK